MSIKIDLKIFLFLFLFFLTSQIEIYILLMIFALIHEIGHLCAGLILGFKPQEISITPIGMKIQFKVKCEEYNRKILKGNSLGVKKAIIALAGPITNFIIVLITLIFVPNFPNKQIIIYCNFLIGVFNLIPIYPLDGGRVIKEILHIFIGLKNAYKYTYVISKITVILLTILSSILILYIQNISIVIILMYLWGLMIVERKKFYTRQKIQKIEEMNTN